MSPTKHVALLGTGLLGRAVAERLQALGYQVIAFNRTADHARPLREHGIAVVNRPELAIEQADHVLLLLTDASAVRSVLLSPACAAVLRGKTIVQMGTIGSVESQGLQREVEGLGGIYCEAPVLGSLAEAKAGMLLIMVGGTEEQFKNLTPLLTSLGHEPRLIGPVGKAAALKLALNQLIAAEITAFALSLGIVRRSGIPVESFMALLRQSALYAPAFDKKLPRLLKRDYHNPNFPTSHLLKDVELCAAEAGTLHLPTESLEGIRGILRQAMTRGFRQQDYSALYEAIDPG